MAMVERTPLDEFIGRLEQGLICHASTESVKPVADGKCDDHPQEAGHVLSYPRHVHVSARKSAPVADAKRDGKRDTPVTLHASIYAALTAAIGTAEDLAACAWAEQHGHPNLIETLAALERRCEQLAAAGAPEPEYRHAVEQLVHLFETIRAAYRAAHEPPAPTDAAPPEPAAGAPGPWRVVVEKNRPARGPIRLDACTVVTDPARCIARTLIDLERAVAHKNTGRQTAYTDLIDEYVTRLAACGCRVRVEVVA